MEVETGDTLDTAATNVGLFLSQPSDSEVVHPGDVLLSSSALRNCGDIGGTTINAFIIRLCPFLSIFSLFFQGFRPYHPGIHCIDDPSISIAAAMAAVYILNACWSVKSTIALARLGVIVCAGLLRLNV